MEENKKYRIKYDCIGYVVVEVEAKTEEEAIAKGFEKARCPGGPLEFNCFLDEDEEF